MMFFRFLSAFYRVLKSLSSGFCFNWGMTYARWGRPARAMYYLNRAARLNTTGAQIYYQRALLLIALGQPEAAINSNPRYMEAYLNRGMIHAMLGSHENAQKDVDNAVALGADRPSLESQIDALRKQTGLHRKILLMRIFFIFQAFLKFFGRMLPGSAGMSSAEKIYDSGVQMQRHGRLTEALERYTEAIRLDTTLVQAYSNRGSTYLNLGQPELAIPDLDEAIRLNPALAVPYSTRGLAHTNLGNFNQAVKDLNDAVRIDPKFADAYSSRGFAHRAAGRLQRATSDFDQAIRIDEKFAVAYNNRADV